MQALEEGWNKWPVSHMRFSKPESAKNCHYQLVVSDGCTEVMDNPSNPVSSHPAVEGLGDWVIEPLHSI